MIILFLVEYIIRNF